MNAEILEQVEKTSKKAPKDALLAQLDEQGQRLVKMALDQNITFGITVDEEDAKLFRSITPIPVDQFWNEFEALLPLFQNRELTGNAADAALWRVLQCHPTDVDAKWAARILNRQLRAGFDIRTYNRVFGEGSVKKFEVQLADTYESTTELKGEWVFEPKLDGNRVVGYHGQPTSRGNKLYPNAEPIFEQLRKIKDFFDVYVPDGEMMGNLGFDQSSGALRRSADKGRKKADFIYWLFDLFTRDEYDSQQSATLRRRKERLSALHDSGLLPLNVKVVPWFVVKDPTHKQVMAITERFVKDGFEGAMAKRMDAPAKFGRGPDLLKVKLFFEDDFKVVGFYEGKGQHKGTLGGIIVEGTIRWAPHDEAPKKTYKIRSECGSGFSHVFNDDKPDAVLRDDVWNNMKDWLGAVVQIQFQSPTDKVNDDGNVSLRLPVFIMRRRDKE
jgi:ATP-dependent DNA ligase